MTDNQDPSHPTTALVSTKDPEKIRGMFGEISSKYDFLNHLLSLHIDKVWRARAARLLVTKDVNRILDVCCGTGDLAVALFSQSTSIGSAATVMGTDFTPEMCVLAKKKFRRIFKKASKIPVCAVADTLGLPFPDHSFDLVTVAFGIRNVKDTKGGLTEMARVCRPGGIVAVLEFSHPNQRLFRALYFWYFFTVLPRVGAFISRSSAYRYLSKSVADFPDTEQFRELFAEVIGNSVEARRFTFGIATLYIGQLPKN